ncbi:uncharacterized protein PHACADRAFT_257412 [Phanerochaete carnosa HHB-10118-sp]|uniref:F-box domain-containing protein n=1 Tax=Phanerochaete carnosa (strain HHB-10118-sp) TaxID=650164 RepID=K5W4P9_PHACS|nr:uncharacterized protein PHACADRAFT_257412 [Phanerochaete carnosa HHB-10118-sp]EKM53914.1 hypothetical protein PHACADRAFT_257412 [Phanerochaete carnosa HHB-10118-sp]
MTHVSAESYEPHSMNHDILASPLLPAELLSLVFDHFVVYPSDLHTGYAFSTSFGPANTEARHALASCSLVCRSWLACSSVRLFAQIVIDASGNNFKRRDDVERFTVLAQTSLRLQAYTTCVSVLGPLFEAAPVVKIVEPLAALQELRLYDCHLALPGSARSVAHPVLIAALRTLILDQASTGSLTRSLLLFPTVSRVCIQRPLPCGKSLYGHVNDFGVGYLRGKTIARLESVSVGGLTYAAADHLVLLGRFADRSGLALMEFTIEDADAIFRERGKSELGDIDRFICTFGQNVTHLTLDMDHLRDGEYSWYYVRIFPFF